MKILSIFIGILWCFTLALAGEETMSEVYEDVHFYELAKEPITFQIDRQNDNSDPKIAKPCEINNDKSTQMEKKHMSCVCYKTKDPVTLAASVGCPPNFAFFCSTTKFSEFQVYPFSGILINFRTGEKTYVPKFQIEMKSIQENNVVTNSVPVISLAKSKDGCGVIRAGNVYGNLKVDDRPSPPEPKCPACGPPTDTCKPEDIDGSYLYE